jgi:hypothetical protein
MTLKMTLFHTGDDSPQAAAAQTHTERERGEAMITSRSKEQIKNKQNKYKS